ncbi:MAG: hypothetical protein ACM3VZ_11375 [Acidobacteriota bacterium]
MKLNTSPRVGINNPDLQRELREHATLVNLIVDGRAAAANNASTAAPTTGTYVAGDFVKNSSPVEAGAAGSKYVVEGWLCVGAGTPGTWVQKRFLTGN